MPTKHEDKDDPHFLRFRLLDKVIVYEADNDYNSIVIATPCNLLDYVAYAKPGDQAWTTLVSSPNLIGLVEDVVRWGSKMLFLYVRGVVGYCDISAIQNSEPTTIMEYLPSPYALMNHVKRHCFYLLESFGDLLMVFRCKKEVLYENRRHNQDIFYLTTHFKVYKLNLSTRNWKEVNELGSVALFVGNDTSMSVCAPEISNCKSNSIYFTYDEWDFRDAATLKGGHDMGLFNMTNKELETVYDGGDISSDLSTALWFMPKF
ncbi:hypothetical protein SOVF_144650 [Spinacia oleracea]|nr:hypothetical protein SOVF_144650 [Spinacia oleracea]